MSNLDDFRASKIQTWPIALLRVYTGVFFLWFGVGKLRRPDFHEGMSNFINGQLDNSFGLFRPFLESVVLPNAKLFAVLVGIGETLIGVAMILGLATRYAAVCGAIMVACFWMTKGQGLLNAQNHDAVWFLIFIVLGGLHAGRTFGLDRKLGKRYAFLA